MLGSIVCPIEDALPDTLEDSVGLLLVLADDWLDVRHLVLDLRHGQCHRLDGLELWLLAPILHTDKLLRSDVLQEFQILPEAGQLGIDLGNLLRGL